MAGGRAELAVKGGVTSTASGSQNLDMKADCWSAERSTISKEGDKEASLTKTKSTNVEEAVAGEEASSMEAEGGFMMCEVEEQQMVRVEERSQKRRAVIRVESEETQYYAMERRRCGYRSQEEVEESGFVPSAVSSVGLALVRRYMR